MNRSLSAVISLFLLVVAAGACATNPQAAPVRGPAPGAQTAAEVAASLPRHSPADVAFMQGMIAHHAQAVEMTAMVAERTDRREIVQLALRIELSQEDEMEMMRRWLLDRGAAVPDEHAHHHGPHASMPGMLTPQEMEVLRAARGLQFDLHFLEAMIRHHEGALTMVEELFSSPGGGQESEIFNFASHVASDQQLEISRMRRLYGQLR